MHATGLFDHPPQAYLISCHMARTPKKEFDSQTEEYAGLFEAFAKEDPSILDDDESKSDSLVTYPT
jgi:hypothetical protein